MKLKKILALAIATIMTVSISACGEKEKTADNGTPDAVKEETVSSAATDRTETSGSDGTGEIVEIKFYEHADNEKLAQALVDAYNAQSENVKVSLSIIANDDYDDKIKVLLSGGSDIDCFWVRGGAETRQLAQTGALYSLDGEISEASLDTSVYGAIADEFKLDGSTYGLCFSKSCWLLFYNKDLFDAAGLDYPVNLTWEEYSDLAASLKTDTLWGGVVPAWILNLGAIADGEYLTDEDLTRTKEYADIMKRWYVTDHSHPSIEEMSGSFSLSAFYAQGQTYMMLNGDWAFQSFPGYEPDFEWCAAPLPIFEGMEEGSTVGSAAGMSVAVNSKHPKEAFDFIRFCCYSEEAAKILAENSVVSVFPCEDAVALYQQKVTVPGTEYVFSSKVMAEKGLAESYDEIYDAFDEEIKNGLVGNVSLEEAFMLFETRRNEILNR